MVAWKDSNLRPADYEARLASLETRVNCAVFAMSVFHTALLKLLINAQSDISSPVTAEIRCLTPG